MADQLTFRLDPESPHLPANLRPMFPQPADGPFDDPDVLFEPWWGGERVLAHVGPPDEAAPGPATGTEAMTSSGPATGSGAPTVLRLVSADGELLNDRLPELADLAARLAGRSAILDGSVVVVDDTGRLHPEGLAGRLRGGAGGGVAYLVFDLIALDGRPLVSEPLERRRERLGQLLPTSTSIVVVPAIVGEGVALCRAAAAQGIAGVMARHRRSPYLPGVTSSLWRLIRSETVVTDGRPEAAGGSGRPPLAVFSRLPLEDAPD